MPRWRVAAALTVALAAAFLLGRLTAPRPVAVKEKAQKFEQDITAVSKASTATVTVANVTADAGWHTRRIYYPSGTIVLEAEGHGSSTSATKVDEKREATAQVAATSKSELREVSRGPVPLPRWAVGASYSAARDGRMGVGADLALRLFGPVWATGGLDLATQSGRIGVRVEW